MYKNKIYDLPTYLFGGKRLVSLVNVKTSIVMIDILCYVSSNRLQYDSASQQGNKNLTSFSLRKASSYQTFQNIDKKRSCGAGSVL